MADTTPETREEREARWWRDWWAADYSWDGLAKKEIVGGGQWGEKTLQHYWLCEPKSGKARTVAALKEAEELVEFDGRWWHIAHLPPKAEHGRKTTWKTEPDNGAWRRLSAILAERLALAKETPGTFGFSNLAEALGYYPSGADRRARLDGTVTAALPPTAPPPGAEADLIHLACDRAAFLADLNCAVAAFGPGASFCSAMFSEDASFFSATFSGNARFDSAIFSGGAQFDSAIFSGGALFDRVTFSEDARFGSATFSGYADFDSATFSHGASFQSATFSSGARFDDVTFSRFASFQNATFSGDASFQDVTFSRGVGFVDVIFSGDARFQSATFSGDASFDSATFSGPARFDGTTLSGNANFSSTTFSGDARFDSARFAKGATFSGVRQPDGSFVNTVFERGGSFRNAGFERQVTFSARVDQPELGFAGAFYGARFADIADFSKSGPLRPGTTDRNDGSRMAIAFAEALFEKTLILTDGSDAEADRAFREGTMKVVRETPKGRQRHDLLDRLEAGCRTVKIAMGKARDEAREQRYYRFQLQAKQARGDTHLLEKVLGALYGGSSDYGASFGWPLFWWLVLTVHLGLVYGLWAGALAGAPTPADLAHGLSFSAGRGLLLNLWVAPDLAKDTWLWTFLTGHGAIHGLMVRLVSALQSILSGILLFLFALAVRRRFQIGG